MIGKLVRRGVVLSAAAVGASIIFDVKHEAIDDVLFMASDKIVVPLLRKLDAETAHNISILFTSYGIAPKDSSVDSTILKQKVLGLTFPNAVGLAAGYDKNGAAVGGLLDLGFGFVEIGSVTPRPQPGNEKPRMFRLLEDRAVINRYGFNSEGAEAVENRLKRFSLHRKYHRAGIVGVNAGKNKTTEGQEAIEADFTDVLRRLGPYADYLVVNVSSPNTPGLRDLQRASSLGSLLGAARRVRDDLLVVERGRGEASSSPLSPRPLPLLVKIDPDLTDEQKAEVASVLLRGEADGIIVSNTTLSRPTSLKSHNKTQTGGLSGAPLKDLSTALVADMYALTGGQVPIIGVGGVANGQDAFEKILAGASLVQMYSMLAYEGPGAVRRVKRELETLLVANGYSSVAEAVGKGAKK